MRLAPLGEASVDTPFRSTSIADAFPAVKTANLQNSLFQPVEITRLGHSYAQEQAYRTVIAMTAGEVLPEVMEENNDERQFVEWLLEGANATG